MDTPLKRSAPTGPIPFAKVPILSSVRRQNCHRGTAPQWVHKIYGFALAVFTFAIVFGAFASNVLFGRNACGTTSPDRDGGSLRNDKPPKFLAYSGAPDVGLCPARPFQSVDRSD